MYSQTRFTVNVWQDSFRCVYYLVDILSNSGQRFFFCFCTFWTKFFDILRYGNNLKLEIIDYIFRKIIMLNEVNILQNPNEYLQKQV